MVELEDRPIALMKTIGPYALKRELSACASFWTALGPTATLPERPQPATNRKHDLLGGSRVAMNAIRAVLGLHDRSAAKKAKAQAAHHQPSAGRPPERYLALHLDDHSSHVAYRFPPVSPAARPTLAAAVEAATGTTHAHILRIEYFTFDDSGHLWLFTPFTGDVDGLRTLGRLLREKRGQMSPAEADRAITQLLEALEAAHAAPEPALRLHGQLSLDHVLVDRHGSLLIELYGLARAIQHLPAAETPPPITPEHRRDEIRSIVEIGYQLITGLRAEEPLIPAGRLVERLDPRWDAWFAHGLDPSQGFDTAAAALAALPSRHPEPDTASRPLVTVRRVFARFRGTRS